MVVTNITIADNTAGTNGGGIHSSGGTQTFTTCTIDTNGGGTNGGGYYVTAGSTTFSGCAFSGNTVGAGGIGPGGSSKANTVTWQGDRLGTQADADFVVFP